jgi:hypothetical protein
MAAMRPTSRALLGTALAYAVCACNFAPGMAPHDAGIEPDVDGFVPDAGPCGTSHGECLGDTLRVCETMGELPHDTVCGWGCRVQGGPHCAVVEPNGGGVLASDTAATTFTGLADVTFAGATVIDGDTGAITDAQGPIRAAGFGVVDGIDFRLRAVDDTTTIAMFRFRSLTVTGTTQLSGSRPIALVADGAVVIDGILDARGNVTNGACARSGRQSGPGGFLGGERNVNGGGPGGGAGGTANGHGGGGGARGGSGGHGGNKPASGGAPHGDAAITALVGGSGGGGGGATGGAGGGGGGAVQVVSNTHITIGASGGINAGGCGGQSGNSGNDAGGGGGAGGAILLEAPAVTIEGALAVNGGAGGAGNASNTDIAPAGTLDRVRAVGLTGVADGGDGAAGDVMVGGNGAAPASNRGGGGGGGIGRVRINTRADQGLAVGAGAVLSPSLTDPDTTCTRGAAAAN